jgi:hypothetical protein
MPNNQGDELRDCNEITVEKSAPADTGSHPIGARVDRLTEAQKGALAHVLSRLDAETAPGIRVLNDDQTSRMAENHPDPRLGRLLIMEALGTGNQHFYHGLLLQLAKACSTGPEIDEMQTNFLLSVVTSSNPKDIFATLLKAQMAAVHNAAMNCLGKLVSEDSPPLLDSAERAANKLLRTYVILGDALARLQARAEPTVNVGTVNLVQGTQAVVGAVIQNETPAAASPAFPDATVATMPIVEESPECAAVPAERSRPRFRPATRRCRPITDRGLKPAAVAGNRPNK